MGHVISTGLWVRLHDHCVHDCAVTACPCSKTDIWAHQRQDPYCFPVVHYEKRYQLFTEESAVTLTGIGAELVVVLMMMLNYEASVMLDRQVWCCQYMATTRATIFFPPRSDQCITVLISLLFRTRGHVPAHLPGTYLGTFPRVCASHNVPVTWPLMCTVYRYVADTYCSNMFLQLVPSCEPTFSVRCTCESTKKWSELKETVSFTGVVRF